MKIKVHKSYRNIVAVCDSELIGKTFEEGEKFLEVRETFYNGEEIEETKLVEVLADWGKEDAIFNIVGQKSVDSAIKAKIILKECVKTVQGIPFALVLL